MTGFICIIMVMVNKEQSIRCHGWRAISQRNVICNRQRILGRCYWFFGQLQSKMGRNAPHGLEKDQWGLTCAEH